MSGVRFASPEFLYLLGVLPLALLLCIYGFRKKSRALEKFGDLEILERMGFSANRVRQWVKAGMVLLAISFLIISLARPQWNRKPHRFEGKGRDIVFILDVSKSMLAEDVGPNRLGKAKALISDFLQTRAGDRVALLVFAGAAVLRCPLTLDYGFFRFVLDDVGEESVPYGGTLIGNALGKAMDEAFSDHLDRPRDIILLSDGEDHGSAPRAVAGEVGRRGIRLITVGVGDEREGRRIPIVNENGERTFLQKDGKEVWTRMDPVVLGKMAEATPGGKFLDAGVEHSNLASMYLNPSEAPGNTEPAYLAVWEYDEGFPFFVACGLLLLFLETLIGAAGKTAALPFVLITVLAFSTPNPANAKSADDLIAAGNKLYSEGLFDQALQAYELAESEGQSAEINYNKGNVHFQMGNYQKARESYEMAAMNSNSPSFESKCHYNLGAACFEEAKSVRKENKKRAAELYELSVRHYRDALYLNPDLTEAGPGMERSRIRLQSLSDEHEGETKPEGEAASSRNTPGRDRNELESRQASSQPDNAKNPEPARASVDRKPPEAPAGKLEQDLNSANPDKNVTSRRDQQLDPNSPLAIFNEEKENRLKAARPFRSADQIVERDW